MKLINWIIDRFKEPSSYAAAGAAVIGISVIINQPVLIIVGAITCAVGMILKEKS